MELTNPQIYLNHEKLKKRKTIVYSVQFRFFSTTSKFQCKFNKTSVFNVVYKMNSPVPKAGKTPPNLM